MNKDRHVVAAFRVHASGVGSNIESPSNIGEQMGKRMMQVAVNAVNSGDVFRGTVESIRLSGARLVDFGILRKVISESAGDHGESVVVGVTRKKDSVAYSSREIEAAAEVRKGSRIMKHPRRTMKKEPRLLTEGPSRKDMNVAE